MSPETALVAVLNGNTSYAAQFGARTYPQLLVALGDDDTFQPAVRYWRQSTVRDYAHDGPSTLLLASLRFEIFDMSYDAMRVGSDLIIATLDGYRGVYNGGRIGNVSLTNAFDDYDSESQIHIGVIEFNVNYSII